jgi:hypothetical protein
MKRLYRVLYIRQRALRGSTIAAPDPAAAFRIATRLCRRWSDNGDWHSITPFAPKKRQPRLQRELDF